MMTLSGATCPELSTGLLSHDAHLNTALQRDVTLPDAAPRSIGDVTESWGRWQLLGAMLSEQEGGGDDIGQTGCYAVIAATMRDAQRGDTVSPQQLYSITEVWRCGRCCDIVKRNRRWWVTPLSVTLWGRWKQTGFIVQRAEPVSLLLMWES